MVTTDKRMRFGDWLSAHKIFSLTVVLILIVSVVVFSYIHAGNALPNYSEEELKVRINEVMTDNFGMICTAAGDSPDWVEIYNYGTNDISLSALRFSDNSQHEFSGLPNITLGVGEYITIYFTDKNLEFASDEPHVNFSLPVSGCDIHLSSVSGILIETLDVPNLRENISWGIDEENGRENSYLFFTAPSPNEQNSGFAFETAVEAENNEYDLVISEFCPNSNELASDVENFIPYVEIFNPSKESIELRGCSLSDTYNKRKYVFPTRTIKSGEYIVLMLGDKPENVSDGDTYTGFRLSHEDDGLYLYSPTGSVIDDMPIVTDIYGYSAVNTAEEIKYAISTPGFENAKLYNTAEELASRYFSGIMFNEIMAVHDDNEYDWIELYNSGNKKISISGWTVSDGKNEAYVLPNKEISPGGYYVLECIDGFSLNQYGEELFLYDSNGVLQDTFISGKQRLGISSGRNADGDRVYFKTATKGKANSSAYYLGYIEKPSISNQNLYIEPEEKIEISCIGECEIRYTLDGSEPTADSNLYIEPINITTSCVIRAKAFPLDDDADLFFESDQTCATYIVPGEYSKHTLPVVSISSSNSKLFGKNGAFTLYEDDIRVTVRFEYYDTNGSKLASTDSVLKISGNSSRQYDQKSFSLNFSERIGDSDVSGKFFRDSELTEFSNLLLRTCGQDWNRGKLRDEFVSRALKNTLCSPIQSAEPCVVYINGEYYGLYYLREKRNEKFIASYTGHNEDKIFMQDEIYLKTPGYRELENVAKNYDLRSDYYYSYMEKRLDFESLIDFWIAQSFFLNPDTHNVCRWKASDGKWHFVVFDIDWGLTEKYTVMNYISLMYSGRHNDREGYLGAVYCPIMTGLLQNPEFEKMFVERYCQLLATDLSEKRLLNLLDEMAAEIENEIPNQFKKWNQPSVSTWESNVNEMREILKTRGEVVISQLARASSYSEKELRTMIKSYS